MTMAEEYYFISTLTKNPCTMVKDRYEDAKRDWICTGCLTPLAGTGVVDAYIQGKKPDRSTLNFIHGTGLFIATRELIKALGEETVRKHLFVGKLFNQFGEELSCHAPFHGKYLLTVRGQKRVAHRRCNECGRLVYSSVGRQYLFPRPVLNVSIYYIPYGGLVVTKDIHRRIADQKWTNLHVRKLPVLDEPLDGLGDLQ